MRRNTALLHAQCKRVVCSVYPPARPLHGLQMSKRACETNSLGERAVRAKVSEQQQAPTAAAAVAAAEDADLDDLYADSPPRQQQQQQQVSQAQPAAAAGVTKADTADDLDLDDLYALSDKQQQQQSSAGPASAALQGSSRASPLQAIVAAAAAVDGTPADQQQQQQQQSEAAAAAEASKQPLPPGAAAAGSPGASKAAAGGSGGGSTQQPGSGRAPPTWVEAPELPSDLGVFHNAVLLVDKPKEWTSFDVCNALKKAIQRLGVKKIGHAGTLDPAATGLLIICTGSGTKSIEGFMAAHKEYSGTLKLGEGTESLDAEMEVNERLPWEHITDQQLVEAAKKLTGDIEQVPPMYSALHHNGKRLHELARAGETVERQARPVTITRFDVHRDAVDKQLVHFYVGCSKGTYIRTLGHDLATSLGSTGHLVALRREAIGDARVDKAWELKDLQDKLWAAIRAQNPDAAGSDGENRGSRGGGRGGRGGDRGGNKGRGRRPRGGGGNSQQQQAAGAAAEAANGAAGEVF